MFSRHALRHTGAKINFLSKNLMFQKCEFCEKWDFENVNFDKNVILKLWIKWKMRLGNCEFYEKSDFENVNF